MMALTWVPGSNAGFILFGTMLRILAMQDPALSTRLLGPTAPVATSSPAPLALLQATSGIIVDSAPSRPLTPDVAAR